MDKPKCPYCGTVMYEDPESAFKNRRQVDYWYRCGECFSASPMIGEEESILETAQKARAAALARWVEPNRVLTMEEIVPIDEINPVYIEMRYLASGEYNGYQCAGLARKMAAKKEYYKDNYGLSWRVWLRKPTEAERAAAIWDKNEHTEG